MEAHLENVDLPAGLTLAMSGEPISSITFVNRGVATMETRTAEGHASTIATIGPEGIVGVPRLLGADCMACRVRVVVAGQGVRIPAAALAALLPMCPDLHRALLRYTLNLMGQIARNTACYQLHTVDERFARSLLTVQDCLATDTFVVTQETLAELLGVRRPTISLAAGAFAKRGIIAYARGHVTILDRLALMACACACYRATVEELELLRGDADSMS